MERSKSHRFSVRSTVLVADAMLVSLALAVTGCGESASLESSSQASPSAPAVSLEAALLGGDDHAVRNHIMAGTDVNAKSATGDTPLHIAAAMGRVYAAEVLIGAGAELETKNTAGVTPLFNASFFGHTEVLSVLIEAGANKGATDQQGTPIRQIMEMPWEQIRPVYEMVHASIGMPFEEKRIEAARPGVAAMLR